MYSILGRIVMVTTFGKWERQRIELVRDLLSDPTIATQTTIDVINNALFDPVNAVMYETGRGYVNEQMKDVAPMPLKELMVGSYKSSLTVMLDSLSRSLNITSSSCSKILRFSDGSN